MTLGIALIIVLISLLAILMIAAFVIYNSFIRLKNKVDEAFATMDVHLKKRYDLIPNLVTTVKAYAKHEKETLQRVIEARNRAVDATGPDESVRQENILQGTLRSLFALAEAYPDLKANTQFNTLQKQMHQLENDIAQSRVYYNAVVRHFNTKCELFPSVIIARMFSFQKKPMYQVEDVSHRDNVTVDFD